VNFAAAAVRITEEALAPPASVQTETQRLAAIRPPLPTPEEVAAVESQPLSPYLQRRKAELRLAQEAGICNE
jgi:hypothetical protein